jgi:flagellar protein FlgJ
MPIIPDAELDRLTHTNGATDSLDQRKAKLKKVTQEFESVFVGMMFKQVRKSMQGENSLFGKSPESRLYQEMMDDTFAQRISESGSMGLGTTLYKRLSAIAFPEETLIRKNLTVKPTETPEKSPRIE